MCEKNLGQCFVLTTLHRLPSLTFCFPSCNFFSMTVFKREIISQSVLTQLKILVFFAQYQKCRKYFQFYRLVYPFYRLLYPAAWNQIFNQQLNDVEQFDLTFFSPSVSYEICIHVAGYVQLNVCNRRQLCISTNCLTYSHFLSLRFVRQLCSNLGRNMCDRNQGFFFLTPYFTM